MVGAMSALSKNLSFATGTGRLLEREIKMLKKGTEEFVPGPQDPLAGHVYNNIKNWLKNVVNNGYVLKAMS